MSEELLGVVGQNRVSFGRHDLLDVFRSCSYNFPCLERGQLHPCLPTTCKISYNSPRKTDLFTRGLPFALVHKVGVGLVRYILLSTMCYSFCHGGAVMTRAGVRGNAVPKRVHFARG